MSTISTGTSLTTAFVVSGDTSGELVIKTGAGAGTTAMTIDAAQNVAFSNPVSFSGNIDANGNLNFVGTGRRITGDFGNATLANRVYFQNSTVNGNTDIMAVPNGTGTLAQVSAWSSNDPANSSLAALRVTAATDVRILSSIQGTGTFLPMTFYTNGSEKLRIAADATGTYTFGGTAPRITGDFSNATLANRLAFQTSTTNGNTIVSAFPNGTGTNTRLQLFSASDPANASTASMEANATSSLVIINADKTGTGTYLPMTFFTGGSERMRIGADGQIGIGGANYGTAGQVLTSNGAAAAPSWQTAASPIPSGSVMLFVQTAAPTGWTKSTAHDNKALRVVSGVAGSGGSVAFTTAFASQGVSGSVSTSVSGSVGNTTLGVSEMPSHGHSITNMSTSGAPSGSFNSVWVQAGTYNTNSTGGSGAHGHGWSGSASSSFSGTAINMAVQYVDVIIATKT